jgi:drug/metabolite transporter (DMT)-like permease
MTYWLLIIVSAYLFFGFASLCDKLVLTGSERKPPHPKAYTFYVGVFSLVALLLIPFVDFRLPSATGLIWIMLDAIVHLAGLYAMYVALKKFDVSRVVATIGATQPIFIFILTWIFWGPQKMSASGVLALIVLFLGSALISIDKTRKVTGDYLKITLFSSVMFSFDYIFAKFVFLNHAFLPGIIWIGIFLFLFTLPLLLKKSFRKEIFERQIISDKKNQKFFVLAQGFGGAANFMQSFAISLAPVAFLATVNSLRGIQYAFLFIATIFISVFFPKILREELSKRVIVQKIISIILIIMGLAMLTVY